MSFRKNAPDKRVHFLRLLRRRGASSADGPDRFVSNDDTVEVRGCQPAQAAGNLVLNNIQSLASITLVVMWARYPRTGWLAAAFLASMASLVMRIVGADVAPLVSLLAVVALGIGGAFVTPVHEAEAWLV